MKGRALFYYFGFPHYRQAILQELAANTETSISFVSGSSSRANIRALTQKDLSTLTLVKTLTFGPFTWDRGIYSAASSSQVDVAVLGPALSSITTWATLIRRRIMRRPSFLWGRCGRRGEFSARRLLIELMNRLATGLLVYGERDLEGAISLGLDRSRVTIVGNALESNANLWSEATSRRSFQRMQEAVESARRDGVLVLAHSGRLIASKQPEVLLDAVGILKADFPKTHLHLIGDGPALNDLRRHEYAADVTFHGAIYETEQLTAVLESAALIVSPYDMGLLALDALRAGIPVLLPDSPQSGPEVEALTIGVNARAFKAGDAASLAAEATRWIETADSITIAAYVSARSSALRFWDPSQVANAILRAIEAPHI